MMKIVKILRVPIAILVVFMMMTSVAFADWVISAGEFVLNGSTPASISLEPGQCATVTVKLSGSGSITGNIEHDFLTHPTQITIDHGGAICVDESVTEYIYAGQTELFFEIQICLPEGVNFHEVSFELFEGCPRMGSGGGAGTYISFGTAIKVHGSASAQIVVVQETSALKEYTVTFDKNGGDTEAEPQVKQVVDGGILAELPAPPTRDGYSFAGWATADDAAEVNFNENSAVTADMTVYAVWKEEVVAAVPAGYTVTFLGNGGEPGEETVTVEEGGSVGQLPAVTRNGYIFLEWNTQDDGSGQAFTAETGVHGDMTVYAVWEEEEAPGSGPLENEDLDPPQGSTGNGSAGPGPGESQGGADDDRGNKNDHKEDEGNNGVGADPDPVPPDAGTLKEEDDRGAPEKEASPGILSEEADLVTPDEGASPVQLEEIELYSPPADMPTEPILPEEMPEEEIREVDAVPELPRTGGYEHLFIILGVAMAAAGVCLILRDPVKQLCQRK